MTMKRARWLFLVFLVLPILACRPYSGEGVTSTVYVAPTATLNLVATRPPTPVRHSGAFQRHSDTYGDRSATANCDNFAYPGRPLHLDC